MKPIWFRSAGICVGVVLASYASAGIVQQGIRPSLRTAAFFADGRRSIPANNVAEAASWLTLNGDILSDLAAGQSQQALDGNSFNPSERATRNAAAQAAITSALGLSPINSSAWLILSLLKGQMNEVPTGPIKTSYFTGPIAPEGIVPRLRVITATGAVLDEDVRLLATSDVRTILRRYARLEPALAASFRQATADGRTYLLEATQAADPKFSALLRQYQ